MVKKQTKPKYPKEIYAMFNEYDVLRSDIDINYILPEQEAMVSTTTVAIYKFDRMAKVTRTVKVE